MNQTLAQLEKRGIQLWAAGDKLHYRAPKQVLTEEIIRSLREHKQELMDILRRREVWEFEVIHVGAHKDPWMVGRRRDENGHWVFWAIKENVRKQ